MAILPTWNVVFAAVCNIQLGIASSTEKPPCATPEWSALHLQGIHHTDMIRELKGVTMVSYENTLDLITYAKTLQSMVQELVDKDVLMTAHVLQLTREIKSMDAQLSSYASQTNSRLYGVEKHHSKLERHMIAVNNRLVRQASLVKESGRLSQSAIITYSVVIIIAITFIAIMILLFLSYFAASATADTPFIQRVARTVFSMVPRAVINGQLTAVQPVTVPRVADLPPSYSVVNLTELN